MKTLTKSIISSMLCAAVIVSNAGVGGNAVVNDSSGENTADSDVRGLAKSVSTPVKSSGTEAPYSRIVDSPNSATIPKGFPSGRQIPILPLTATATAQDGHRFTRYPKFSLRRTWAARCTVKSKISETAATGIWRMSQLPIHLLPAIREQEF